MIVDQLTSTIQLKICYFGPALSGKTTSIKALFAHYGKKDRVLSIDSTIRRTLFFDYGTISFKKEEWNLKIHLYATTGQDFYIITRPITMQGIDGIIFVADSQQETYSRDLTSWNELRSYFGNTIITLPKVIAFNKQDLTDKYDSAVFLEEIEYSNFKNVDYASTTAITGKGIAHCFEVILNLIFKNDDLKQ